MTNEQEALEVRCEDAGPGDHGFSHCDQHAGISRGECDCCGKQGELARVWAYGIETFACARCRGDDEDAEAVETLRKD